MAAGSGAGPTCGWGGQGCPVSAAAWRSAAMAASVLSAWAVNCCHHAVMLPGSPRPARACRRGVLLPLVGGFGVGLAGFGGGLDAAAVEFLAGSAGGQPLGFVVAFPLGAGLMAGLELVGQPGFPGGGGAGEGGVLVAAVGLVELGLPREFGGGLRGAR